jgi:hypothetical protein
VTAALQPAAEATPWSPAARLTVVCALLYAAGRFVPLPLLDDIVRTRVRQLLVSRLLRGAGRTFGSSRVGPLWRDDGGCGGGCLSLLWKIPLKLLLFPIRKILALVTAVRGFAEDVTEMLLFGRAIDRSLVRGLLPEGTPDPELSRQASLIRSSFNQAYLGVNKGLLAIALAEALRGVQGLPAAAARAARAVARSKSEDTGTETAPPEAGADQAVLDRGTSAVLAVLQRPDVAKTVSDFDLRLDAALGGGSG